MATLKYINYDSLYPLDNAVSNATRLIAWRDLEIYRSTSTNASVVLEGHGFTYPNGALSTGTLDRIEFRDQLGELDAVISGLKFDISKRPDATTGNFDTMLQIVLSGKDKVIGSGQSQSLMGFGGNDMIDGKGGDDNISGGVGNDRMTGGKGADTFLFTIGQGRDVITDFDADGGPGHQDFLQILNGDVTDIEKHGHDTIIHYGSRDEILLLGVAKSDVTLDGDFL